MKTNYTMEELKNGTFDADMLAAFPQIILNRTNSDALWESLSKNQVELLEHPGRAAGLYRDAIAELIATGRLAVDASKVPGLEHLKPKIVSGLGQSENSHPGSGTCFPPASAARAILLLRNGSRISSVQTRACGNAPSSADPSGSPAFEC